MAVAPFHLSTYLGPQSPLCFTRPQTAFLSLSLTFFLLYIVRRFLWCWRCVLHNAFLGGCNGTFHFSCYFGAALCVIQKEAFLLVYHCCEYAFLVRRESGMTTTTTITTTPTTTTTTTNNNSSSSSNETTTTEIWGSCMLLAVGCCFSWPCRG